MKLPKQVKKVLKRAVRVAEMYRAGKISSQAALAMLKPGHESSLLFDMADRVFPPKHEQQISQAYWRGYSWGHSDALQGIDAHPSQRGKKS